MAGLGRNFWRMWTASGLSNAADGAVKTALPLVAVSLTRSPAAVAGVSTALGLPWLLFALQAGALSDRLDRRRTMLTVNCCRGALLLVLAAAAAAGHVGLLALYAVAFLLGIGETLFDTSAQSILPAVVPRDRLSTANSRLYAVELTANQFVGPPLGGLLVAAAAWLAFGVAGALWAAAGMVLLTLSGNYRPAQRRRTMLRTDIAEGLRYLAHHRVLRTLALVTGGVNLGTTATSAILVLYAVGPESPMGLTETGFGLLLAASAVGSVAGAVAAQRIERSLGRANTMAVTVVLMAAGIAGPAISADVVNVTIWMIAVGFGAAAFSVIAVSLRQGIVPDQLLGRVNAGYRLVAWGTIPIGATLGGFVADAFGLRAVFVCGGAIAIALLAARLVVTDEAIDQAEAEAERRPPAASNSKPSH